jgi:hypothetical protein
MLSKHLRIKANILSKHLRDNPCNPMKSQNINGRPLSTRQLEGKEKYPKTFHAAITDWAEPTQSNIRFMAAKVEENQFNYYRNKY